MPATLEQILSLAPGRKTDALVAHEVMGWTWVTHLGSLSILIPAERAERECASPAAGWTFGKTGRETDVEGARFFDSSRNPPNLFPAVPAYSTSMPEALRVLWEVSRKTRWYELEMRPDGAAANFTRDPRHTAVATLAEAEAWLGSRGPATEGALSGIAQALAVCRAAMAATAHQRWTP